MGDEALTNLLNRFEQRETSLRLPAHEHFSGELRVLSKLALTAASKAPR
jgi:cardiolipin synthase